MDFFAQQTINGLALGSVFALYALGLSLVFSNLKVFYVAHAGVFTFGAVLAWLFVGFGWPVWLAFPAAIVGTGLINIAAYFLLIHHLRNKENSELAGFISSLGGLIVLTELAGLVLNHQTTRLPFDIVPSVVFQISGLLLSSVQIVMAAAALVLFLALWWVLARTQLGREIKAVAFDRTAAQVLGVRTIWVNVLIFFLTGCLAAVGAILVALSFNVIQSGLGETYLIIALSVLVIGGFGSTKGTYVAGLIVGLISSYTAAYLPSALSQPIIFGLLLLFLAVRPGGLFRVVDTSGKV